MGRETAWAFFKEIERLPAYVSYDRVIKAREIHGVIETGVRFWWVTLDQDIPSGRADLAFRLWESIFKWTIRTAFVIEREMKSLPWLALTIKIQLAGIERWQELDFATMDFKPAIPSATYGDGDAIILRFEPGCLHYFFKPSNLGERLCLAAIIDAIREATPGVNAGIATPTDQLVAEIVRDDGARFFHVLRACCRMLR